MENLSLDEGNLQTLVVSPNGLCSLVCVASGYVHWSTFTNPTNIELYQSDNDGSGKDYMELQLNEIGETSLVYHYADSTTTQIEIESSILEDFFGRAAKISFTHNDFNVEHATGYPSRDELNCFRIRRENYRILAQSWYLKFSIYKAFFASKVESGEKYLLPCRVHQTFCMEDFIQLCRDLNIRSILDESIKDIELRHRISSNHRIIRGIEKVSFTEKEVYEGSFETFDVAVKVIKQKKNFSKIYNNLWVTHACDSIVRFYGAEYVEGDGHWILAFERCGMTLRQYGMRFKNVRFFGHWRSIMREILVGLEFIHNKGLCHNNLNPDHILLSVDSHARICGMSRCKRLTDESRAWDLYCFARLLLFCFTLGAHTFEDEDHDGQVGDYQNMLQNIPYRLNDVRCVIEELLNPVALERPCVNWVRNHLWLWDSERRLNFIKEVSDTILRSGKNSTLKSVIDGCYYIPFQNRKGESNWGMGFDDVARNQMFQHGGYDTKSVCELLRFMRNFMNHRDSVKDKERPKIGSNDYIIERKFDASFPGLLSSVYTQMEVFISQLPGSSRVADYYSDR